MRGEVQKEFISRRAKQPKRRSWPVRFIMGIIELVLYLIFAAIVLGILALVIAGFVWIFMKVAF